LSLIARYLHRVGHVHAGAGPGIADPQNKGLALSPL
jgi:hypothetical protein